MCILVSLSETICGEQVISLEDQHLLNVLIPTNRVSFNCVWLVTARPQRKGSFVAFLDLLSLSLTETQWLSFGSGDDNNNRSTLMREIDTYTSSRENGSSYFFFKANFWISLSSTFSPSISAVQPQVILLRLENSTSGEGIVLYNKHKLNVGLKSSNAVSDLSYHYHR